MMDDMSSNMTKPDIFLKITNVECSVPENQSVDLQKDEAFISIPQGLSQTIASGEISSNYFSVLYLIYGQLFYIIVFKNILV